MSLAEWQTRLDEHFARLSRERSAANKGAPIFGLEHGLSTHELDILVGEVRTHIASAPPLDSCSLPWIVYASELGYRYVGDEYWQTFEEETLGWTVHGDRNWIRDSYRSFALLTVAREAKEWMAAQAVKR